MLYIYNRIFLRCISHILGHGRIERLVKNCIGGEKASREFPKCHSKNVQKNGNSIESKIDRKPLSWRKLISLVSAFILLSISENLKNRLKIRTTGDISTWWGVQIPTNNLDNQGMLKSGSVPCSLARLV